MANNKLDIALRDVRAAHDAANAARVAFRQTLNAWARGKTEANTRAHVDARNQLNIALENLRLAEQRRAAARSELFQLQAI